MGKHRFGYAGVNTQLGLSTNTTCRLRNIAPDGLERLIEENLMALESILRWNKLNQIGLFRIGSGLIPYGSHRLNSLSWPMIFSGRLQEIGAWAEENGLRLSMHPGQFVVLNSLTPSVVQSAMDELSYHATVLGGLGIDTSCKIILHGGGLYGSKQESLKRFIQGYHNLPSAVKRRVAIENDDRLFDIWDVLKISEETGVPVVFDNLHHEVNNKNLPEDQQLRAILECCFATWSPDRDGVPEIHYSTQEPDGRPGSHTDSIDTEAFMAFFEVSKDLDYDVVFECKDKEQSVLRILRRLSFSQGQGLAFVS